MNILNFEIISFALTWVIIITLLCFGMLFFWRDEREKGAICFGSFLVIYLLMLCSWVLR